MQFHVLLFLSGVFYCYGFNKADFFLAMDEVITVNTTRAVNDCDMHEYEFFSVPNLSSSIMKFKLRTVKDAHIALTSSIQPNSLPITEIIIGRWSNKSAVISKNRSYKKDIYMTGANAAGYLSKTEFRGFWVSWKGGNICVGRENERQFMSWQDPEPFPVRYVGVCSGYNHYGTWKIKFGRVMKLPLILLPVNIKLYRWPEVQLQNETKSNTKPELLRQHVGTGAGAGAARHGLRRTATSDLRIL